MRKIVYLFVLLGSMSSAQAIAQLPSYADSICAGLSRPRHNAQIAGRATVVLSRCEAGRRELARIARDEATKTAVSAVLSDIVAISFISDEALFEAGTDISGNTTGSPETRIAGLTMLLRQVHGVHAALAFRNTTITGERCYVNVPGGSKDGKDARRVANAHTRLRMISEKLALDAVAPDTVRLAARCIRNLYAPALRLPKQMPALTLEHQCGTRFVVNNPGKEMVTLAWDVVGTAARGWVTARPGHTSFLVPRPGQLRLTHEGAVIATAASRTNPCK